MKNNDINVAVPIWIQVFDAAKRTVLGKGFHLTHFGIHAQKKV